MTDNKEWSEFRKLVEIVRAHKANSIETKIGNCEVKIRRLSTTIRIELQEEV